MSHTESLAASEAKRLADKYDSSLDKEIRQWLVAVTSLPVDGGTLCDALKSGVVICEALNKIAPGSVKSIYTGSLPFKQMENIANYIQGCKDLGMKESNLFQTVDLYDAKDPAQVLNNMNHLAVFASTMPNYKGPLLKGTSGPAQTAPACSNSLPSTRPIISKDTNDVPTPGSSEPKQGGNRPRPASMLDTKTATRGNNVRRGAPRSRGPNRGVRGQGPNNRARGARGAPRGQNPAPRGSNRGQANPGNRGQAPANGRGRGVSRVARVRRGRGARARGGPQPRRRNSNAVHPSLANYIPAVETPTPVPAPPPVTVDQEPKPKKQFVFDSTLSFTGKKKTESSPAPPPSTKTIQRTPTPTPAPATVPISKPMSSIVDGEKLLPRVASVSSLAEDIATKEMFKYDPEAESSAVEWLEALVGVKKVGSLHEWLKSGVVLCNALNKIKPGSVKPPEESKISFKHRENIVEYLEACQKVFGINQHSLFQTVDLYEEKNMNLVITSIHVVAKEVGKDPNYKGPRIREVVASANNALFNVSFVSGLPPIDEETPIPQEEASMIEWINSHLSERNLSIKRIRSDLRDGVKIIKLLEYFSGIPRLGTYEEHPTNLWNAMQNSSLLLKFIHQQTGERVDSCRGQDITMGQLGPIIHLLKFIRAKFDRDYVFKSQNLTIDSCRVKILEELLETEDTYVSQIRLVCEQIIVPVTENEYLPEEEIWNVFTNLVEIRAFNEVFLTDLRERVEQSIQSPETILSDIFLSRDQFVPLYSAYVNNFDMATLMVKFNKKKFKPFKKLVKAFEKQESESSSLDLDSFLILPVQRMPRYLLLLKELYKYTPSNHPDYAGLTSALDYISGVLSTINEKKRQAEATNTSHKILNIDKSMLYEMEDFEGIVHPKRTYLYEGVLKWEEMEEEAENPYWFLFNDIIVFCSDLSNDPDAPPDKQFRYVTLMPLKFIDDVKDNPDSENTLDIVMEDEVIELEALSVESKKEWQKQIRNAKEQGVDLDLVW